MKNPTIHPYRVLVADDQADIRDALRLLLKRESYETQSAASPAEALAAIESREFDAVLIDLNYARHTTSGQEGLDLLSHIQAADSTLPVIVMTAWSSVEIAVEAMRRGPAISFRNPGTMRGYCPSCAPRSTFATHCGRPRGWRPRIGCSALNRALHSSPKRL